MTTCPSGVHYMHLVDHARAYIEKTYKRPFMDRCCAGCWRGSSLIPCGSGWRFWAGQDRAALCLSDAGCAAARDAGDGAQGNPPVSRNDDPQDFAGARPRRMRVALMTGCAQKALNTDINDATIRLLRGWAARWWSLKGRVAAGR
jgi:glycolate oxidase iron-sulfur subunit